MLDPRKPEEGALLIAVGEHAVAGRAYESDSENAQTRKVIAVGELHFPPDLDTPGASLHNQERWLDALQSLRNRPLLTIKNNIYTLHGAGKELLELLNVFLRYVGADRPVKAPEESRLHIKQRLTRL